MSLRIIALYNVNFLDDCLKSEQCTLLIINKTRHNKTNLTKIYR